MNNAKRKLSLELYSVPNDALYCIPSEDGQCITCSDEALPATVLRVDQEKGMALVSVQELEEEIDITLLDAVVPGDQVLVHGGVALALVPPSEDSHA